MNFSIEQAEQSYDSAVDEINRLGDECGALQNSLQQLKAEIVASLHKFLSCQDELKYDEALGDFIERMRQLSAV